MLEVIKKPELWLHMTNCRHRYKPGNHRKLGNATKGRDFSLTVKDRKLRREKKMSLRVRKWTVLITSQGGSVFACHLVLLFVNS